MSGSGSVCYKRVAREGERGRERERERWIGERLRKQGKRARETESALGTPNLAAWG